MSPMIYDSYVIQLQLRNLIIGNKEMYFLNYHLYLLQTLHYCFVASLLIQWLLSNNS